MNRYHKQAEGLVREVIEGLQKLLPRDGEDIACYAADVVNEEIRNLINVKVFMACADATRDKLEGVDR